MMRGPCRWVAALALSGGALVVPALAETFDFSSTFLWEGTTDVSIGEEGGLFLEAEITGTNSDVSGPDIMANTSQVCRFTAVLRFFANEQDAEGVCVTTDADGDEVFMDFSCSGTLIECSGTIVATGGNGKFAGVTGNASFRAVIEELRLTGISRGTNFVEGTFTLPD